MEITVLNHVFKIIFFSFFFLMIFELTPVGKFSNFRIESPVELDGVYSLNTLLNDAEHLYEGLIKGPESLVEVDGEIYTGVHGGNVIKLSEGRITNVTKFGLPCDGQWQEAKCGRPFGLTVVNNSLYIADAYYGIWKYDVTSGKNQCLVSSTTSIDGHVSRIFNSIAVRDQNILYWTDSSIDVDIQNGVYAMFLDGSGRVMEYSLEHNVSRVLLDNLFFPNGIVISPDGEYILVAEMITSRLIRHYVSGPNKGKSDIFLDRLPGFPDKLKVYGEYIIVPLVHARDAAEPVLFQYISPYTFLRRIIVRTMVLIENTFKFLNTIMPNQMFEKIVHKIGHFESVSIFAPKRVTIVIVDWKGKVVETWHNLDGTLEAISDVHFLNDYIYYGSPYNTYIGRTQIPNTDYFGKIFENKNNNNNENKEHTDTIELI